MRNETFIEILTEKLTEELTRNIRKDLQKNLFSERKTAISESHFATEHQLLGQIDAQIFQRNFSQSRYQIFQKKPQPRPAHALSPEQRQAWNVFFEKGIPLADNFSLAELKTAFRKLAIRHHPDQGGTTETFLQIHAAHLKLLALFK